MGIRQLYDGLLSALSGAGRPFGDRGLGACYIPNLMTDQQIEAAFRASWLMRKIITKPATEMTRAGRDWQADKEAIEKIEAEEKRLGIKAKLQRAEVLRGKGGGGMVLYVAADRDQGAPLDPKRILAGGLTRIHVWHRSRFTLGPMIEKWDDPWFGHPSYYEVHLNASNGSTATRFHPSRVVAFRGKEVDDAAFGADRWWWGDSMVEVVKEAVDNVHEGENGFAKLIRRSRIRRMGVPRLLEKVATSDAEANFTKRVAAIAMGENNDDITWYDAGDGEGKGAETITDVSMTWTGIPDIKASYLMVAAAAANMPATVLLGKSPDGMNATGDSDSNLWEQEVKARQDLEHRPCLDLLDVALIPSALGKPDDSVWWEFAPLSMMSEKDLATTNKTKAETVKIYHDTGLLPVEALEKGVQNMLVEDGTFPGFDDALGELPEDERFPSRLAEELPDPENDNDGKEAIQTSAGGGRPAQAPARRAANDALEALGYDEAARTSILDAIAGGAPTGDHPFADGFNPGQPRDERGRWKSLGARIEAHAERALADKSTKETTSLGKVSPRNARLVMEKTGLDLKGYERRLQSGDIRHAMNSHGNAARETARGQVALVPADFASIPQIVDTAHTVTTIGKLGTGKGLRIDYAATIAGNEFRYVEQVRPKGQIVALKTMRKAGK